MQEYLKNPSSYDASERDFNRLGYQFLRLQKCECVTDIQLCNFNFPDELEYF